MLRLEAEEFLSLARKAHDNGWRIATHAIGDRAIEQVLRVYEALTPAAASAIASSTWGCRRQSSWPAPPG